MTSHNIFNIEFTGCSGVGKSTFCEILKQESSSKFIFRDSIKEKLIDLELTNNTLIKILEKKITHLKKLNLSNSLEDFLKTYFRDLLKIEELCLNDKFSSPFINDDGFSHNFSNEIDEVKNNPNDRKNLIKIFSKKKIIHLQSNSDSIIKNLVKRNKYHPGAANDWITYAKKNNLNIEHLIQRFIIDSNTFLKTTQELGAKHLTIDPTKEYMTTAKIAENFIFDNENNLKIITKQEFFNAAQKHPSPHWRTQPLENRWNYHSLAISVLEKLNIKQPEKVLELGTVGIQLIPGSETMDIDGYWEYEGKSPTYLHNARNLPWPVNNYYEAIVALRVFQYLGSQQEAVFKEVKRIAKNLIIVVPRGMEYIPKGIEDTKGITYEEFLNWNDGIPPKEYKETNLGDFYHWEF